MASYLVSQGYQLVNDAFSEVIGNSYDMTSNGALDSTDVVSMGKALTDFDLVDKFYGAIANRIAKTVCCALNYSAKTRNILKDSVTWGGFIQKIYTVSPDAVETQAYNVESGESDSSPYSIEDGIDVFVKVFGGSTTWSLEFKTPTVQLRKCFLGDAEMMAFIDSQFVQAQSTAELQKESLVDLAISTGIAYAYINDCVVNPLDMYNEQFGKSLTSENCEYDADYMKFANMIINKETRLLSRPAKRNTPDGYLNYSSRDNLTLEVQSDFAERSKVYLESGTYHDDKVSISGNYDDIDFWQMNTEGVRKSINIANADLIGEVEGVTVTLKNVIALARDNDYVACHFDNNYSWSLPNQRARTHYYGFDFEKGYAVDGCQCAKIFVESSHLPFDDSCTIKYLGSQRGLNPYFRRYEVIPGTAPEGKVLDKVYNSLDGSTWNEISASGGHYYYTPEAFSADGTITYGDCDILFKCTWKNA